MLSLSICPCCDQSSFLIFSISLSLIIIYLITQLLKSKIFSVFLKDEIFISIILRSIQIIFILLIIFIFFLVYNDNLRSYTFSIIHSLLSSFVANKFDEFRCKNIKYLSGRILEIGPGPGLYFNI